MSREDDFSISELRRKREQQQAAAPPPQSGGGYGGQLPTNVGPLQQAHVRPFSPPVAPVRSTRAGADDEDEEEGGFHVDTGRMLAALQRRWIWLLLAAVVVGGLGFGGGYYKGRYSVTVTLTRPESGGPSPGTLKSLLQDWQLVRRVAEKSQPHIAADKLITRLAVEDEARTERIHVTLQGQDTKALVDLANLFASEAIEYSKNDQLRAPQSELPFWQEKIQKYDEEIVRAEAAFAAFQKANGVTDPDAASADMSKKLGEVKTKIGLKEMDLELADFNQINQLTERWAALKLKRETELAGFTDIHPSVLGLRAEMERLEKEIAAARTNGPVAQANSAAGSGPNASLEKLKAEIATLKKEQAVLELANDKLPEIKSKYVKLKSELDSLREKITQASKGADLSTNQIQQAKGYFWVTAAASVDDVDTRPRMKKAVSFGTKGALAGLVLAAVLVLLVELKDRTMKTAAEVERATGLSVLTSLGDLDKLTPEAREKWAFRAWTVLAGQLNTSANHGMVCGFVSSGHGEGRSTWIKLLAEAASRRGLRVLTVATKPSGTDEPSTEAETVANEKSFTEAVEEAMTERQTAETEEEPVESEETSEEGELLPAERPMIQEILTLSPSALAFPAEVTRRFTTGGLPAAHIPLPGWVWDIDRRRQWQMALAHWRAIDNLVLLVELPPASVPESVLLAESLPQIIWLADSGKASIHDTKEQLEMMRHAKCHIVGAVLNHEPDPIIKL